MSNLEQEIINEINKGIDEANNDLYYTVFGHVYEIEINKED